MLFRQPEDPIRDRSLNKFCKEVNEQERRWLPVGDETEDSSDHQPGGKQHNGEQCSVSVFVAKSREQPKQCKSQVQAHHRSQNMSEIEVQLGNTEKRPGEPMRRHPIKRPDHENREGG